MVLKPEIDALWAPSDSLYERSTSLGVILLDYCGGAPPLPVGAPFVMRPPPLLLLLLLLLLR